MIIVDTCTRACGFGDVNTGKPCDLDDLEPLRVAESVQPMELTHAVITSVNRDDLPDGGSAFFAKTIHEVKRLNTSTSVEVLIPDFKGDRGAIDNMIEASPRDLNHTIGTDISMKHRLRRAE